MQMAIAFKSFLHPNYGLQAANLMLHEKWRRCSVPTICIQHPFVRKNAARLCLSQVNVTWQLLCWPPARLEQVSPIALAQVQVQPQTDHCMVLLLHIMLLACLYSQALQVASEAPKLAAGDQKLDNCCLAAEQNDSCTLCTWLCGVQTC